VLGVKVPDAVAELGAGLCGAGLCLRWLGRKRRSA
jgi:hypothetical protein